MRELLEDLRKFLLDLRDYDQLYICLDRGAGTTSPSVPLHVKPGRVSIKTFPTDLADRLEDCISPDRQFAGPYQLPSEPSPIDKKVDAVNRALGDGWKLRELGTMIFRYIWTTPNPNGGQMGVSLDGMVLSDVPISPEVARALADLAEALRDRRTRMSELTVNFSGWTVDDVVALNPCVGYPRERVAELWGNRERLGIADVCDLPIPAVHRIWLLCDGPWPVIKPVILAAVERTIRRVLEGLIKPPDQWVEWAERWLSGEDRTVTSAVAAWSDKGATEAGWSARADTCAAAEAAAEAALRDAWAALKVVWAAARAAGDEEERERKQQIADFRALERIGT